MINSKGHSKTPTILKESSVSSELKPLLSAADIRVFLAENLPYYEREDRDDFIYLVRAEDIERVSLKLHRMIKDKG